MERYKGKAWLGGSLGCTVATPGALDALARNNQGYAEFIARHVNGDWGDLDAADKRSNDEAVGRELRILSAYTLRDGTKIWIITEADRSSTTVLLPGDY